jgi:hypothetical protein
MIAVETLYSIAPGSDPREAVRYRGTIGRWDAPRKETVVTISKLIPPAVGRLAPAAAILALAILLGPSAQTKKQAGGIRPEVANLLAIYGADIASIDRAARDYKLPSQFEWKNRAGSASQTAILFGDPAKPGLYVELLKRGPDDWSQPHSHPNDRYITVLAGTMLIGTGAKQDRENTVSIGPGGVIRDIANQMHYDGTGPEGVTLEIIGMGPSTRN